MLRVGGHMPTTPVIFSGLPVSLILTVLAGKLLRDIVLAWLTCRGDREVEVHDAEGRMVRERGVSASLSHAVAQLKRLRDDEDEMPP
jgi:hypothetical protein